MTRLAVLAALLGLAACGPGGETRAPEPFGTRAATDVLRDAVILAAVKAKLTADDPDSATTLAVAVQNGVVTLRGTVHDGNVLARLPREARSINGVKRVVTEVRVDPHGPRPKEQFDDAALAARIQASIALQVGLQHVGVRVTHGVATLDGSVHDARTRAAIVATARGTSGIRNVVDRIRVEGS
ncbi:MAG: BON domain-containing protein [Candidatus Eremiobacteraeota bacterium]|nr:BON domain-containing protein [Candidatus Eremiobacteraeota bacterium]